MFYIALLFLILLGILAIIIAVQNYGVLLSTNLHLTLLFWSLPGIPVLLLCVLGIFLGGLMLYVIAARAARRDELEMKVLRARIEELETLPAKSSSGKLSTNFAPPVVPLPGFAPGPALGASGPVNQPSPPLGPPGFAKPGPAGTNQPGPAGPLGPGPAGSMNQWQSPSNQLQNMSPSASGNTLPLPPRPFPQPPQQPPQQPQQPTGGPRPPFPRS